MYKMRFHPSQEMGVWTYFVEQTSLIVANRSTIKFSYNIDLIESMKSFNNMHNRCQLYSEGEKAQTLHVFA